MMRMVKAGMLYFALVFGVGFVLGTFRVLWIVPIWGTRIAELMEAPIMLLVTIFAARWVVRRMSLPPGRAVRLGAGFVALGILLATEFTVVLAIRGLTFREYLAGRDPAAGIVYVLMLGAFAAMPALVARK